MTEHKEDSGRVGIDFRPGIIGFSGLFRGLGNLIDLAARLNEAGLPPGDEIESLPREARGVYGLKIGMQGGKPVIESFGNIIETSRGPVVKEVREPMVDIFDENGRILVVAELPGVAANEIKIEVSGDILGITASGEERKYAREIILPNLVKKEPVRVSYWNGVLEIILEKVK
jgi:HSP20 family protein